jgi:hypothetical protein
MIEHMYGDAAAGDMNVGQTIYISYDRRPWDDALGVPDSHWASRDWTMQEEFLASRIISYTSLEMTWQCSTLHKIEAESPPSSPIMNASLFRNLNSIVKQQSSKLGTELESLTEHQDDLYSYSIIL